MSVRAHLRWYRRHCGRVLSAAWTYLRDGDEEAFDVRIEASLRDRWHPSPFVRLGRAVAYTSTVIGAGLLEVTRATVRAAAEWQAVNEQIARLMAQERDERIAELEERP